MLSYLHKFCSEEVKLLLIRMESFPEDFIDDDLCGTYLSRDEKGWLWRRIVKVGSYNWLERIILNYNLRKIDKKLTKQKIYEIFTQCNSSP